MLNDDLLGRVLDRLFNFGVSRLFSLIAMSAFECFGLEPKSYHLDSTSMSVQGQYVDGARQPDKSASEESPSQCDSSPALEEEPSPVVVEINHGYSRDRRPDLKQFMVDMICSGDGGVPLAMNLGSGNQNDQKVFAQRIVAFREQWEVEGLFVADSALYSQENLQRLG